MSPAENVFKSVISRLEMLIFIHLIISQKALLCTFFKAKNNQYTGRISGMQEKAIYCRMLFMSMRKLPPASEPTGKKLKIS